MKVWEANKDFITWLLVLQHGNPGKNYAGHSLSLWFGLCSSVMHRRSIFLVPSSSFSMSQLMEGHCGAGDPFTLTDVGTWGHGKTTFLPLWGAGLQVPGECSLFCRLMGVCQQLQEGLGARTPGQQEKRLAGDDAVVPAATMGATKGMWLEPLIAWGWPTSWPGGQDVAVPPPLSPCASAVHCSCGTAPRGAALHSNPCTSLRVHLQLARV